MNSRRTDGGESDKSEKRWRREEINEEEMTKGDDDREETRVTKRAGKRKDNDSEVKTWVTYGCETTHVQTII